MYIYYFEISLAKKRTNKKISDFSHYLYEACANINTALTFQRDKKKLEVNSIDDLYAYVSLSSENALTNPVRSLSALTRYLTTNYGEVFAPIIFNKILFQMKLIKQEVSASHSVDEISDEELIKSIIDLLYGYTATTNSETLARNKAIKDLKQIMHPFIKRLENLEVKKQS